MNYTIKKMADLAKVSVRTLDYYDEIGLLNPSSIGENGYRHYGENELLKLQQIMFFKELEFSLDQIRVILENPKFNLKRALIDHKKVLQKQEKRLKELIATIERTVKKFEGEKMKDEELFEGFDKEEMEKYHAEAKERWGRSDAYKQSAERVKKMGKEGLKKIQEENDEIALAIVTNMPRGIESIEIQELITRHHGQINKFYDCSLEIYSGLASMYVADERFAKHYRRYHEDLPNFLSKAMLYWCEQQKKNN